MFVSVHAYQTEPLCLSVVESECAFVRVSRMLHPLLVNNVSTNTCIERSQKNHLVASLVSFDNDSGAVVLLHLGALDHLIGHVDVLCMVLVVVDLKSLLADLGLERSVGVRERCQLDFHREPAARLSLTKVEPLTTAPSVNRACTMSNEA